VFYGATGKMHRFAGRGGGKDVQLENERLELPCVQRQQAIWGELKGEGEACPGGRPPLQKRRENGVKGQDSSHQGISKSQTKKD